MKNKKCKNCLKMFTPERAMQSCCSFECSIEWAKKPKAQKQYKMEKKKELIEKYPDKSLLRKKIQSLANKYGRLMDYQRYLLEGCITCGSKNGKIDGGHFLPTSTYPTIRYFSKQIKCQCVRCNQYGGGMPLQYENKMRILYGDNFVNNLKQEHRKSANYSIEYMKKYIRVISKRIKKLELRNNIL